MIKCLDCETLRFPQNNDCTVNTNLRNNIKALGSLKKIIDKIYFKFNYQLYTLIRNTVDAVSIPNAAANPKFALYEAC